MMRLSFVWIVSESELPPFTVHALARQCVIGVMGGTMRTLLLSCLAMLRVAAEIPSEPPMYLHLIRSPRQGDLLRRAYEKAQVPVNVFGLRSVTGAAESWFVEWHDSFQSIGEADRAVQAELTAPGTMPVDLSDQTAQIAMYRPNWSYRPDLAIKAFARARYVQVIVHHFRPGSDSDFGELMKARRSGLDRLNLDRPDIVYQVVSGTTTETFIVLTPMATLKTLDDAIARIPASGEAGPRPRDKVAAEIELNRENLLFRVDPGYSFVDQSFVDADPEFWRRR